jgi:hypothetical protein
MRHPSRVARSYLIMALRSNRLRVPCGNPKQMTPSEAEHFCSSACACIAIRRAPCGMRVLCAASVLPCIDLGLE